MVKDGQNIFDYCLQVYGKIDNIIDDLLNNNNLTFSSELKGGQELTINENKGNEDIKNYIKINKFEINNRININPSDGVTTTTPWILATGFWNDSGKWYDSKVWID